MKKNRLAVLIITPCAAAALIVGTVAVINSGAFDTSKLVEGTTPTTASATPKPDDADYEKNGIYYKLVGKQKYKWDYCPGIGWSWFVVGESNPNGNGVMDVEAAGYADDFAHFG